MVSANQSSLNVKQGLSELQLQQFARDGYLIVRACATDNLRQRMIASIEASLNPAIGPLEYEADVNYPGAPPSKSAAGGMTPRRLLNAYARDATFREWASMPEIVQSVKQLMVVEHADVDRPDVNRILLTQNHHNCIMTKMPSYSSSTNWHQDIRYWSYDRPELINVWLALGDEYAEKGSMQFIPGSHKLELDRGRFDADLFLRQDLPENKALIDTAVNAELKAGDVLFFHCRTFHVAGENLTQQPKYSVVFSYHVDDNCPIPGTRSALLDSVVVG